MSEKNYEIEELKKDIEEARALLSAATRKKWKLLINSELSKLEEQLKAIVNSNKTSGTPTSSTPKAYSCIIRNYSWDQSEKFLKLYVTLPGVQDLNKDNIKCTFQDKGLTFKVNELNGKNHELIIANLAYPIVPDKSHIKIKTDMVIIFGAKTSGNSWEAVTAEEKKVLDLKKASKPDAANKDDPTSGLMGLMKQMYDDGDDEMKRMLNKTWYENQMKGKGGMPGGLGDMGMGDLDI